MLKTLKMPSEVDRAWAAGLFDGEGHIGISTNQNERGWMRYRNPQLTIGQADSEVLFRFHRIVVLGKVYVDRFNEYHKYCVYRWDEIQVVVATLWPYLSTPKKRQITSVQEKWKVRDKRVTARAF